MGEVDSVKVNTQRIIMHSLHAIIQNQYLKFGDVVLIRIILNCQFKDWQFNYQENRSK